MTRAKEETSKKTATYDGVCVSDTEGYDRALDIAVARRTRYETEEGELITVHELNIGGQVFTVRSFFGLDERRTPADIVRRMIDAGENTNDGCAEIQTSAHAPDCWSDTGKCDSEIDQKGTEQMVFFTADTHFGHENVIRFTERPFSSAHEMDEALIENWNARVHGGDKTSPRSLAVAATHGAFSFSD